MRAVKDSLLINSDDMFSDERVGSLFELARDNASALAKLENEYIEYKESFSLEPQILRTCAAFANSRGGYIIFGVKDKTRELVGLSKKHSKLIKQFDLKDIYRKLNDVFVPRIMVGVRGYEFQGKAFGIFYVYESTDKPVMAVKNSGKIKDRDIYYSYGGTIEKIRRAELLRIMSDLVEEKTSMFLDQVVFFAKRGPENIATLDLLTGDGYGPTGHRFAIDDEALNALKVVKEGEFSEKKGAPVLKLAAEVTTVYHESVIHEDHDIDKDRVVYAFLKQETVRSPESFLSAMSKHDVTYAPLYYFAHLAEFNIDDVRKHIENVENPRRDTARRLLVRLQSEKHSEQTIALSTFKTSRSSPYLEQLLNKKEIVIDNDNFKPVMSAIRSLKPEEIDKDYILDVTRNLYQYMTNKDSPYRTDVRKLICYLDRALYPLQE